MPIPYTPPYAATGPWTNNASPGISAAALNEIEGYIAAQDAPTAATISGSTSGTAAIYQNLTGTIKYAIIVLTSFRNGGGTVQNLTIPTAFTSRLWCRTSDVGLIQAISSGSTQNWNDIATVGNPGGTTASITNLGNNAFAYVTHAVDTIGFVGSDASTHNGMIIIEGI